MTLWLLNFVPNMQRRTKWFKRRENLTEGDIVLVIDPKTKRCHWNMGVVTKTYPGKDGHVRSVQIRSKDGIYHRPITKICLLLAKAEYNL